MMPTILDAQQIRMHALLKDPVYRKWFAKAPYLPPACRSGKPWYLYLQPKEDGPWQRAAMPTYAQSYKWISKRLSQYHDFAIVSKRKTYIPPVYRPKDKNGNPAKHKVYWTNYPRNHSWCPYCRRPTIFAIFTTHHAIKPIHYSLGLTNVEPMSRCTICGIREEGVKPWLNLGR